MGSVMRKMEYSIELTDVTVTLRRYRAEDAEPIYRAVRESIEEISPKDMGDTHALTACPVKSGCFI